MLDWYLCLCRVTTCATSCRTSSVSPLLYATCSSTLFLTSTLQYLYYAPTSYSTISAAQRPQSICSVALLHISGKMASASRVLSLAAANKPIEFSHSGYCFIDTALHISSLQVNAFIRTLEDLFKISFTSAILFAHSAPPPPFYANERSVTNERRVQNRFSSSKATPQ